MNFDQLSVQMSGLLIGFARSLVLIASTVIVLFVTWVLLHLIWSRGDQAVTIRPFVVVDPSGNLKNADNGFAQILLAQMAELQDRILSARAVLIQAASGQSIGAQPEALSVPEPLSVKEKNKIADQPKPIIVDQIWPRVEASATDKVELKVQGVDIGGLVSWIKSQLIPERKGLGFTAHISGDGEVTIAGDIRELNIEKVNNIYLSPSQRSPIRALDDLALQIFRLRLVGEDPQLQYIPLAEFRTLIDRLNDVVDTRIALRPDLERRKWYKGLSTYFSNKLEDRADWPAMAILAAETARRGGDYSSALKYFELTAKRGRLQKPDPREQQRAPLVAAVITSLKVPAAAYSRMNAKVDDTNDPIVRRVLDDGDVAGINQLRAAFGKLYKLQDADGYAALAGLHGVPGWYSWNHQQNSRSPENHRLHLPWYRAFLLNFERAARAQSPGFALRCWDWTRGGIPKGFSETKLSDGQMNPLVGYKIDLPGATPPITRFTVRSPGTADQLPNKDDVENVLSRTEWSDFSDALEDLGDQGHGWVSGDMGVLATGAYDPIFYAHHCNIDRLWATWQKMHEPSDSPAAIDPKLLDLVLEPFGITVRDVLDTKKLGYTYE